MQTLKQKVETNKEIDEQNRGKYQQLCEEKNGDLVTRQAQINIMKERKVQVQKQLVEFMKKYQGQCQQLATLQRELTDKKKDVLARLQEIKAQNEIYNETLVEHIGQWPELDFEETV